MTDTIVKEPLDSQSNASHEEDSSSTDEQVQVFSEEQLEQLEGIVNKRVQKTTDKRFQQTNNKLTGLTETLQRVADVQQQYGVTQEQAVSIIERDEKIDAVLAQQSGVPDASVGAGADVSELANSILSGAGLDPNDDSTRAFVNTLAGKSDGDVAQELTKWAVERSKRPHATDGDVIASGGKTGSEPEMQKLFAELAALKKLPITQESMAKRRKVSEAMKLLD